jgi:hypothetical protein
VSQFKKVLYHPFVNNKKNSDIISNKGDTDSSEGRDEGSNKDMGIDRGKDNNRGSRDMRNNIQLLERYDIL